MILKKLRQLLGDKSGNVALIFAIALPLLVGAMGLGVEGSGWIHTKHDLQNAADEAAIAAASNASLNYQDEAKAVASKFNLTDGVDNVVIVPGLDKCPDGTVPCYRVTISKKLPLLFTAVVGYAGNDTIGLNSAQKITATALAIQSKAPREYCLVALASSGANPGLRTNGAPFADLNKCNIMSNTNMLCNGHNLNADYGDAKGTNTGCGNNQTSNVPFYVDQYSSLAANIPPNPCSSYPQMGSGRWGGGVSVLPVTNQLQSTLNYPAPKILCGDVGLVGDITFTGKNNVLVIENGQLNTNGYKILTAPGASATVIFSGDNATGYTHAITGGGTVDLAAPTSGPWSGVAYYQDPKLTSGVDLYSAGNSPSWNITGLVYLPHANVTFSGAVGKATNGFACFVIVVDSMLINGTGSILNRGQCPQAGLAMPTNLLPLRGKLVA